MSIKDNCFAILLLGASFFCYCFAMPPETDFHSIIDVAQVRVASMNMGNNFGVVPADQEKRSAICEFYELKLVLLQCLKQPKSKYARLLARDSVVQSFLTYDAFDLLSSNGSYKEILSEVREQANKLYGTLMKRQRSKIWQYWQGNALLYQDFISNNYVNQKSAQIMEMHKDSNMPLRIIDFSPPKFDQCFRDLVIVMKDFGVDGQFKKILCDTLKYNVSLVPFLLDMFRCENGEKKAWDMLVECMDECTGSDFDETTICFFNWIIDYWGTDSLKNYFNSSCLTLFYFARFRCADNKDDALQQEVVLIEKSVMLLKFISSKFEDDFARCFVNKKWRDVAAYATAYHCEKYGLAEYLRIFGAYPDKTFNTPDPILSFLFS